MVFHSPLLEGSPAPPSNKRPGFPIRQGGGIAGVDQAPGVIESARYERIPLDPLGQKGVWWSSTRVERFISDLVQAPFPREKRIPQRHPAWSRRRPCAGSAVARTGGGGLGGCLSQTAGARPARDHCGREGAAGRGTPRVLDVPSAGRDSCRRVQPVMLLAPQASVEGKPRDEVRRAW